MSPDITVLSVFNGSLSWRSLRIEGGTITPEWEATSKCASCGASTATRPWCEFTLWLNKDGKIDPRLGSFGGSVWPAAWPEIFHVGPPTIHGQTTSLTERGLEMVRAACREFDRRVDPSCPWKLAVGYGERET